MKKLYRIYCIKCNIRSVFLYPGPHIFITEGKETDIPQTRLVEAQERDDFFAYCKVPGYCDTCGWEYSQQVFY